MSGHSKWSKVKHQKATTDVAKAASFTKASRAITVAVREGGGISDPDLNFRLRLAIDKARQVNMPKENIQRAIANAAKADTAAIREALYEAYGPGNVAFLIQSLTDNPNRAVASVKNLLERNGARMVTQGAVRHLFTLTGYFAVSKDTGSYDALFEAAVAAGADDIADAGDMYEVFADPKAMGDVRKALELLGPVTHVSLIMRPNLTVPVDDTLADSVRNLAQKLEDLEDVVEVFTNDESRGAA